MVVHHLIMLAIGLCAPPRQGQQMGCAAEDLQPVIEEAHPQPVPDQAGRHRVKDLAQGEAAGAGHRDDNLFKIRAALPRQIPQMGALRGDPLAPGRVPATDDLINKGPIAAEVIKVGAAAHQKCVPDGCLEMAVGACDCAVLVGYALVVTCGRHAIMGAKGLVTCGQVVAGLGIQIAERGREAASAMTGRCAAR